MIKRYLYQPSIKHCTIPVKLSESFMNRTPTQDHMKYKLEFGLWIHLKNAYWTGVQSVLKYLKRLQKCLSKW